VGRSLDDALRDPTQERSRGLERDTGPTEAARVHIEHGAFDDTAQARLEPVAAVEQGLGERSHGDPEASAEGREVRRIEHHDVRDAVERGGGAVETRAPALGLSGLDPPHPALPDAVWGSPQGLARGRVEQRQAGPNDLRRSVPREHDPVPAFG
jgi:hypothetical protein